MNDEDAVRKLLQWKRLKMDIEHRRLMRKLFLRDYPILFVLCLIAGWEWQTQTMGKMLITLVQKWTR